MNSPTNKKLVGVVAFALGEAYAVDDAGNVLRYDGTGWTISSTIQGLGTPTAIGGSDAENLFVVTSTGRVVHVSHGASPASVASASSGLSAIVRAAPGRVIAVGDLLHYDGVSWATMPSPAASEIDGIAGAPTGSVFAFRRGPSIWRYDP